MRDKLKKLISEWQNEPRTKDRSDTAHEAWAFTYAARELADAMKPKWVPVSERLPDEYLDVFTFCDSKTYVGFMQDGRWVRADGLIMRNVTHWHEIDYPQPPEVHP